MSVVSNSEQPHRRQPNRLLCPWDSPGKNTGVGCHFLLQCMKVKSESEVAQSCLTLSDPMDCSPPGSSVHGILQARALEWGAIALSWYLIVVLICISLIICGVNLFMCPLAIWLSSSRQWKTVYAASVHFLIRLFVFLLLTCMNSLYTLDINLYQMYHLQISSPVW